MPGEATHAGRAARAVAGFLLAPVLVVLLARTMTVLSGGHSISPETAAALAAAEQITLRLDRWLEIHRRLPSHEEGLAPLAEQENGVALIDPWGRPFLYELSADRRWADVVSRGRDGQVGGNDEDSDLSGRYGLLSEPREWTNNVALLAFLVGVGVCTRRSPRSDLARGLLSGTGALAGVTLTLLLAPLSGFSPAWLLTLLLALAGLTSSIALLRDLRGSHILTAATILVIFAVIRATI